MYFNEEDDWDVKSNASATKNNKNPQSSGDDDDGDSSCSSGFFDIDPYQKEKIQQNKNSKTETKSLTSKNLLQQKQQPFKHKQFHQSEQVLSDLLPASSSRFEALRREQKAEKKSLSILTSSSSASSALQQQNNRQHKITVSGFHKPGDAEFSLVAIPPEHLLNREGENIAKRDNSKKLVTKAQNSNKNNNNNNKFIGNSNKFSGSDSQAIGSTVWAGSECRCLRCEILRTSQRWAIGNNKNFVSSSTLTTATMLEKPPSVLVVLLDADNFAFPAFCRKPPSNTLFQYLSRNPQQQQSNNLNSIFLWAFYGANFEKAFKVDLERYVKNSFTERKFDNNNNDDDDDNSQNNHQNQKKNNNNSNNTSFGKMPKYLNTWGLLQSKQSVQCTRCEGSSQAADLVIEAVATMLGDEIVGSSVSKNKSKNNNANIRLSLLTGDKGLRTSVGDIWAKAANSTKNDENDDDDDEVDDQEGGNAKVSPVATKSFFIPDFSELLARQRTEENFVLDSDMIWKMVFGGFSSKNMSSNVKRAAQRRQRDQ